MTAEYLKAVRNVLENGELRKDRTGTGTFALFAQHMKFNLKEGFPIQTTKKIHWKSVAHELLWFLSGSTNIKYLNENGVKIWDNWADENGELGPVYGCQWRGWKSKDGKEYDQIKQVIDQIKNNKYSRRLLVSSWNVGEIDDMNLPPCHLLFQFFVGHKGLSCQVYQRSADIFLGVPFNIASYALLTHLIAGVCGLEVDSLNFTFGDLHLYTNHETQADLLLTRKPLKLPNLVVNTGIKTKSIDDIVFDDFYLDGYNCYPEIKAPIAV